jgi:6-phosphogluconolactonase
MKKNELLVYVGTYTENILFGTGQILEGKGEGIHIYRMDPATGALSVHDTAGEIKNPSYLAFHPNHRFLYAVNELKSYKGESTGTLSAFSLDADTGRLRFINKVATHGTDPCHVTVDRTGKYAFVANFASGSAAVLPVREDGGLEEASAVIQHQGSSLDPVRQNGPHAHSVTLDTSNRFAYIPDLGLDKLMIYRFDAEKGKLVTHEQACLETRPGAGPRHFVFHPSNHFAYLINELDSTILSLVYDGETGTVKEIQTVSSLPQDFKGNSTCADIVVDPAGRFLYASNRGHESIAIYRIDGSSGKLNPVGHESTRGKTPRNFTIDRSGTFLFAANQDTDNVVHFRIDGQTGLLTPTGQVTPAPTPVCLKIFEG